MTALAPMAARAGPDRTEPSGAGTDAVRLAVLALAALLAARGWPVLVAAVGVLVLGPAHVVFEMRSVRAAVPALRSGPLAVALPLVAGGAGAARLLGAPRWTEAVALGALAAWPSARRHRGVTAVVVAGLTAGAVALALPGWWLVVLAHGHNLLPVVVAFRSAGRAGRAVLVGAHAAVAAVAFAGPVGSIRLGPGVGAVAALVTPPPFAHGDGPARWLVLFGFGQLLHYGLWCLHLPRVGPTRPGPGAWSGSMLAAAAAAASGALGAVALAADASTARRLYAAAATYHVVAEAPALAALVQGRVSAPAPAVPRWSRTRPARLRT